MPSGTRMIKGDSFFIYFIHFEEKAPVIWLQTREYRLDTEQDAKVDAKVLKSSQGTLGGESSKEIISEALKLQMCPLVSLMWVPCHQPAALLGPLASPCQSPTEQQFGWGVSADCVWLDLKWCFISSLNRKALMTITKELHTPVKPIKAFTFCV